MSAPVTIDLFRRVMQQEISCAERLAEVLKKEQDALAALDMGVLEGLTPEKQALLGEMEQRTEAHAGFLAARGLPPGRKGTEAFLDRLAEDAAEHELWRRLRYVAGVCQEANQVNGKLVALSRARTQRALDLLRGTPDNAKTYGKGGYARNTARSQFIAST